MAKRPSDNLHQLIHSLSANEKRYFKMYMQKNIRHDHKIFDILFDAIDEQDEYDEKELLKKFGERSFTKQFSLTKTRLYDQVLRSLHNLYADSSIDAELKQDLHFVEILFRKTLYKQAEKLLYHTRKKALKHERISTLIEISTLQKKLVEKSGYSGGAEEQINGIHEGDQWILKQLSSFNDSWNLKSHVFTLLHRSGSSDKLTARINELQQYFSALSYDELTVNNKFVYHHTLSASFFGMNDYANCYSHLTANEKLIRENVILFRDEPNVYFSVLSNLIFICNRLGKNEEAIEALRKLKNVEQYFDISNNEDLQLRHFNMLSSAEITLYRLTGNYGAALGSLSHIESSLEKFHEKLNPTRKAFYYFNLSAVYLANAKLSQSLKWCNELLNDKSIQDDEKIRHYSLALSVLIHYDLDHPDLLPGISRQMERHLKDGGTNPFFAAFVRFAIGVATDTEAQKQVLNQFKTDLEIAEKAGVEANAFEFFDFTRWADSRLSGLPFSLTNS